MMARERDDRGAIAVLFALSSAAIFAIAALVVDLGLARDVQSQSQNASDASALAAGNTIYADGSGRPDFASAVSSAKQYAAANMGTTDSDWASCTDPERPAQYYVVPGMTQCISFDSSLTPHHVRVRLPPRVVETGLGALAGVEQITINSRAEASLNLGDRAACGICIVGPGYHDIQNGDIKVTGSSVRANGDFNVSSNGHLLVQNGTIGVQGTATGSNYNPVPVQHQEAIGDPLAGYAFPALPPTPRIFKTDPCSQGPGIYGNVSITAKTVCTLTPGIYYVTGTWDITSQGSVDATSGVTLLFTCSTQVNNQASPRECAGTGEPGGRLSASGQGGLGIRAPTSGPTQGISILYDRHNTSSIVYTGQGSLRATTGTIYAASAQMTFNGNGNGAVLDTLLILGDLQLNGNPAALNTQYTAQLNAPVTPVNLALSR